MESEDSTPELLKNGGAATVSTSVGAADSSDGWSVAGNSAGGTQGGETGNRNVCAWKEVTAPPSKAKAAMTAVTICTLCRVK